MNPIDEGMAPIRAVKHAMSSEAGHDIRRYMANLKVVEKRYAPQIAAARRKAKGRQGECANETGTRK